MKKNRTFKIIKENLKNKKMLISVLLVLKTISAGLGIIIPYMVGETIDHLNDIHAQNLIIIGLLSVASLILESYVTYRFALLGQLSAIHVRSKLWGKVLELKVPYYDKTHSGEISSRVINDTSALSTFLTDSLPDFYTSLLTLILMVIILFLLDNWLGAIFCFIFPLIMLVMLPVSEKMRKLAIIQQEIYANLNEILTETVEHIKFVKAYNAENCEKEKVAGKMAEWYQNMKRYNMVQAILSPVMAGLTSLALFVICGIGAYRVQMGYITTGTIIIFALYLVSAVEPVEMIGNFFMEYRELQGALQEVNTILGEDSEKTDGTKINENTKCLTFHKVQFGYGEEEILRDISFSVKENERIAIVGKSGAGKTTIFSLIERFYDVSQGKILWGNESIESISLHEWRDNIGYVFQDKMLVSGTIRENLIYGIKRQLQDIELVEAVKRANIYEYILKQENKFDTYVGEKGELLSGGQQQRIAIARMFLRDPQILLLDEVTANLDAESEYQISNSLKDLYKGRITLIIAHKLQTVIDADKIIVLQDGRIIGYGKHDELVRTNPYYQSVIKYELKK